MQAAAHGRGTLGIPMVVAKHFVEADKRKRKKKHAHRKKNTHD